MSPIRAFSSGKIYRAMLSCYYTIMNRAAVIEQLKATQSDAQQAAGAVTIQKFVAHPYQARKQYRLVCERPNKGNKAIEREVISSYQVAQSLKFNGGFRAWEHLLRIGAYGASVCTRIAQKGS